MSVTPYQTVSPVGRIQPEVIWPGASQETVGQKLVAFIAEGANYSEGDDAATLLWVYYRATDEQYQRMIGMPSSVTDSDEGSSQYTDAQIERIRQERDGYLEAFEDLVAGEVEPRGAFGVVRSFR